MTSKVLLSPGCPTLGILVLRRGDTSLCTVHTPIHSLPHIDCFSKIHRSRRTGQTWPCHCAWGRGRRRRRQPPSWSRKSEKIGFCWTKSNLISRSSSSMVMLPPSSIILLAILAKTEMVCSNASFSSTATPLRTPLPDNSLEFVVVMSHSAWSYFS